jgi:muconolactone D-isomerase
MEVTIPHTIEPAHLDELKAQEKRLSQEYQRSGEWVHLWRTVGKFGNISILDVADNDRLHTILSSLPLFPFMTIRVLPLAQHPSAIDRA